MNRVLAGTVACALLAGVAAAQEDHFVVSDKVMPQIKIMGLQGGVMGKPVKGAPYSGLELTETTQVLADGTRIHNEVQTQVYRDSEGRMRRETPKDVTIWDPVANASWVLNPKTQTARKLRMGVFYFSSSAQNGKAVARETFTYNVRVAGPDAENNAKADAEKRALEAKMKADMESAVRQGGFAVGGGVTTAEAGQHVVLDRREKGPSESLGKRMMEGVNAEGTKTVATIEAGAIGNDRPIQSVTERWYSPELQTVMMTRHTDPRTGEESFKLVNVSRAEPPAYLFQVPAGYQIVEQK